MLLQATPEGGRFNTGIASGDARHDTENESNERKLQNPFSQNPKKVV